MIRSMTAKRSVVLAAVVPLVVVFCASTAGGAAAITKQERAKFASAMARYPRVLAATTTGQVITQMRTEESRLEPCVPQLKSIYGAAGPRTAQVDMILGLGVHDTGERWYDTDAIPLDVALPGPDSEGAKLWVAKVRLTTHIDVCEVVGKWAGESDAEIRRSSVYALISGLVTPSPLALLGTRFARVFAGWGFSRDAVKHLDGELNTALSRYEVLNAVAGKQYIGWLQAQGIYQLMQAGDQRSVDFAPF
jgi:hypothetical protein